MNCLTLPTLLALALALAACGSQGRQDGDAETDACLPSDDVDGDGISDVDEECAEEVDTDEDGIPDYLDEDSDGDGILDEDESGDYDVDTPPVDSDGDGAPDFRDLDSDDNGIPDEDEGDVDTDGDGIPDHADPDNDGDALDDVLEIGGDPSAPVDFDGDSVPDHMDLDSDDDTISDRHEENLDVDDDGMPDRHDLDTDGDGIPDEVEAGDADIATAPVDSDGDGIPDFRDRDSDNDGLSDALEAEIGTNPTNSDSDGDGAPDLIEMEAGTDPLDPTDNPRTNGWFIFIMYYNEPGTPDDDVRDPDPTMDHLLLETGSTGPMEITTVLRDDPSDLVDTVADFIDFIEPSTMGGWPDPGDPSIICVSGLEVADLHEPLDGRPDAFTSVPADTPVCFDIHVKPNWTAPSSEDVETYRCDVDLVGDGGEILDTRRAYFLVPPVLPWFP